VTEQSAGRFAGAVAVITGGASGMGLATARRWVADGGQVVIGDVDESGLMSAAVEFGAAAKTLRCDVTSEADQQTLMQTALDTFGSLDAAVACPAIGNCTSIVNMPLDEWKRTLDIGLTGVMLTFKHAGRLMNEGGAMVAIASINAVMPGVGCAGYNTAKAGVNMLVQIAAMELANRRIRVNAVCPGLISTPMSTGIFGVASLMADWKENTPLRRHGEAAEVAALICWLLSSEASYITGDAVMVDGGTHMMRFPDLPKAFGVSLDPQ
jgi:3-oxoacyl-[acyl-carrier protein] reductase